MTKKLGKGLNAIFGDNFEEVIAQIDSIEPNQELGNLKIHELLISDIIPNPNNPRKEFDKSKLHELSLSIKENGLLTPISVKKTENNKYYIIAGERRYQASKLINSKTIKAIIHDIDDKKMQELSIIENIQRENLNPIEVALAIDHLQKQYNMTHEKIANVLGKSRSYVTNSLRSLDLNEEILEFIMTGKLTFSHIRPLITLSQDEAIKVAKRAFIEKWSVRDVEEFVKKFLKYKNPQKTKSNDLEYVEKLFREKLGAKVYITKSKITISYSNVEHLNSILQKLNLLEEN